MDDAAWSCKEEGTKLICININEREGSYYDRGSLQQHRQTFQTRLFGNCLTKPCDLVPHRSRHQCWPKTTEPTKDRQEVLSVPFDTF